MNESVLHKKYGLATAVAMVIGIVIGSGVFFKAEKILNATGGDLPKGILAWLIGGYRVLTNSKKPIRSMADMQGLKLRVPVPGIKARLAPTDEEFAACRELGRQTALHLLGRAETRAIDMASLV